MANILTKRFLEITERSKGANYLTFKLLYHLAPAIEEVKPAVLFNLSGFKGINSLWEEYGDKINLGLEVFELQDYGSSKLLLFYKQTYLRKIILDPNNSSFLEKIGYSRTMNCSQMLDFLQNRFKGECPHELGLFLGFPLKDVEGYIENQGKNYLLKGYWKVYQEPYQAIATFNSYNMAKVKMLNTIASITFRLDVSNKAEA